MHLRLAAAFLASTTVLAAAGVTLQLAGSAAAETMPPTSSDGASPGPSPASTSAPTSMPSAPTNASAAPGDAAALVTWTPSRDYQPHPLAGWEVAVLAGGAPERTLREMYTDEGADISDDAFVVTGLTNGTAYTFTVRPIYYVMQSGELPGNVSEPSAPVTPEIGLVLPTEHRSVTLVEGEAAELSTGTDATAEDPVVTTVTVPQGSTGTELTITETTDSTVAEPTGYSFFGQQVDIVAPVATVTDPLVLQFRIDASLIPAGTALEDIQLFRTEGTETIALATCVADATFDPFNSAVNPEPACVHRVQMEDGDVVLYALTAHASSWNTGITVSRGVARGCQTQQIENHGCEVAAGGEPRKR